MAVLTGAFISAGAPGSAQIRDVTGDVAAGQAKAAACAACHGPNGNSTNPDVPSLAGQMALYTYYQLLQFREGRRVDAQMAPFAAALSDTDMRDVAAYFGTQAPAPPPAASDPAQVAAGQRVSATYFCESCHLPGFAGQNHVPRLAGLSYGYLVKQLRGYKAQTRADADGSMTMAAQPLSEADIESVAHYILSIATTPPAR
jgi:cytochrome c553